MLEHVQTRIINEIQVQVLVMLESIQPRIINESHE